MNDLEDLRATLWTRSGAGRALQLAADGEVERSPLLDRDQRPPG